MYAIVKTGGKQYKVKPEDLVEIERLEGEVGTKVTFVEILAVGEEGGKIDIGAPLLAGATVEAEIVDQFRGKKLIAFKMKRRKGYRKTKGHRQEITKVKISAINAG
ncbi:MAG: 50S ribosomal protein L21 [Victivallaceae bacterium]